ncbi:efflux RND transporter periplasmic adaptor subunit [Rhodopirellula bahusiensis]|nr:efflux RND transporter periplasmic adaptor subunit [Rhodopirellula bahusiensis]
MKSRRVMIAIGYLLSAVAGGGIVFYFLSHQQLSNTIDDRATEVSEESVAGDENVVNLPKAMWESARLKVGPVQEKAMAVSTWATGKVVLNEDRVAHIYSITEGVAYQVPVHLGQRVEKDQILAVIDSREVGTAKLELYQARLQEEFAKQANDFAQEVKKNANELLDALDANKSVEEINEVLGDKPIGKYREQLLTAYAELIRARADYERLKPVAATGAVAGKQLIEVEAKFRAAEAGYKAVVEQLRFSIPQDALQTEQALRQARQAVDVAMAKLSILGYFEEQLRDLKPLDPEECISHFVVRAPFAGTIISKNVVLAERVGTDTEMFRLADLSSVWVQADIYQKDLPNIELLGDTIQFRAVSGSAAADHTHEAKIFYRGDVVDADTRTLLLRAVTANPDNHLKAGMFVEINLPGEASTEVLAVPATAVQEVKGEQTVFVKVGETEFRKVPVVVGPIADGMIAIEEGLNADDNVVTSGAFVLKSELMKDEIGDDD